MKLDVLYCTVMEMQLTWVSASIFASFWERISIPIFTFTIMKVMGVATVKLALKIFLVTFALCMITFESPLKERIFIYTVNRVRNPFER